jgi:hypothetical protein
MVIRGVEKKSGAPRVVKKDDKTVVSGKTLSDRFDRVNELSKGEKSKPKAEKETKKEKQVKKVDKIEKKKPMKEKKEKIAKIAKEPVSKEDRQKQMDSKFTDELSSYFQKEKKSEAV